MHPLTVQRAGEVLAWDSGFWGFNVARTDELGIDAWAKTNAVRVCFALIPADDPERVEEAQWRGWKLRDVRVTLTLDPGDVMPERHVIYPARPEHHQRLLALAGEAHRITRFYADPTFPDRGCDLLYQRWLTDHLASPDWEVLASLDDHTARGYCSIRADKDGAEIGLIAVEEAWRRVGIGRDLVAAAVLRAYAAGSPSMQVVTQGRNVPALRTFEKVGFRVSRTDLWFHKTFW